jgi:hypothetical protein
MLMDADEKRISLSARQAGWKFDLTAVISWNPVLIRILL